MFCYGWFTLGTLPAYHMMANSVMTTAHNVNTTKQKLCDNNTIMYTSLITTLLSEDITQLIRYDDEQAMKGLCM